MATSAASRTVQSMRTLRDMELTAAVTHEGRWYVARCLDVEVTSQGESVEEALENLREALELYFEDAPMPDRTEPPIIASVVIAA
jgi:predicted RNase H-like HicB family nuclease